MSVVKEWECPLHGYFESTHPLCLEIGCDAEVKQVFLTPPNIGSNELKRFDAGIRKSSDMYKIGNFRTARAGEAAYGNSGKGMLWGDECQKALGVSMEQLVASSATPMTVRHRDGHVETINKSVMRELGSEGMTKRTLPRPAETTGHVQDRARK